MTGRERVQRILAGEPVDRLPVLPMIHTGLAGLFDIPLKRFATDADAMASVIVRGFDEFGYDGVQLSLGVVAEAEALGATVEHIPDAGPVLREYLLADLSRLDDLRSRDPVRGGRMPMFKDAVRQVVERIGDQAYVLVTLRGPLLAASQLRGPANILVDMLEAPDEVERMLAFTTEVVAKVARAWLATGAHGVLLGEATCSPSFISPDFYRRFVMPHHKRLVAGIREMGWAAVGLHVCGETLPIFDDMIATGVDFFDVDYLVSAQAALEKTNDRVALRGNLDPGAVFRFGTPERVRQETARLLQTVAGTRWIIGSGCDIPPGTPAASIAACVHSVSAGIRNQNR